LIKRKFKKEIKLAQSKFNDQTAIDDLRQGGKEGAKHIFHRYGGRLFHFFQTTCHLSPPEAQAVLQETLWQFFNMVREEPDKQTTYFFARLTQIAAHEAKKMITQKNHHSGDHLVNELNELSEQALKKELCYQFCLVNQLDKFRIKVAQATDCLQALTFTVEGWSIEKMAETMGRTETATEQFFDECRDKLKPYLQPCWDDCDQ
jgi:DNA-directed RNA polymerase specialized sigma24 family protein